MTHPSSDPIRLADFVMEFLADRGVTAAFMVTGGGAMHLNDAVGRSGRIRYICCHHEQACSMAAESYARVTNRPALVQVTTGPGGVNSLNGVYGAFTDSMPMIVISGQVKRETCLAFSPVPGLRQLGDQEIDIISMVRGITKYAVLLRDASDIFYELGKAWHLATTGRPGPVWIDIPIDLQNVKISPADLRSFDPGSLPPLFDVNRVKELIPEILQKLYAAERPVILAGSGVRIAEALPEFNEVVEKLGIPVVPAWSAPDVIPYDHPCYAGRAGTIGDRAGNFVVQNSDVLLVLGSRLPLRQISYNLQTFARYAHKIVVDVDEAELRKPMPQVDLPVHADLKFFLSHFSAQIAATPKPAPFIEKSKAWLAWSKERVAKYPVVQDRQRIMAPNLLNPYPVLESLIEELAPEDVVVCADATAAVVTYQVAKVKAGQRIYSNAGSASMGYDFPASVGAAAACGGQNRRIICLAGDGSSQMNIQELQTIIHHQFPIKIFLLNNQGYLSIRSTQLNFFKGHLVGEGPTSGVSFPNFEKLAQAYGFAYLRIDQPDYMPRLRQALNTPGPVFTEIMLDPGQGFEPKLSSRTLADGKIVSAQLEDLSPFLSPEELASNLLIPRD